jgi:hypothetical protein
MDGKKIALRVTAIILKATAEAILTVIIAKIIG